MTRTLPLLALVVASGSAWAQESDPKQLFLSATASFAEGDYASAERQFEACRAALGENATVEYNLAMTHLRLEAPGRARVHLERCLKLSPRDREARMQLRHLLARIDEPAPPPRSWLHALWDALKRSVTLRGAIRLAAAANLIAALVIGLWLLSGRRRLRWIALLTGLFAVATWPLMGSRLAEEFSGQRAIVVAESASIRGGPGDEFGEIVRLSEGQAATLLERPRLRFGPGLSISVIRDERGLWREVRAPSGARGYVRHGLIERV